MDSSVLKSLSETVEPGMLLGRSLDPAVWLMDRVKEASRQNNFFPLSEVTERFNNFERVEKGSPYVTTNSHGHSITPVQRTASNDMEVTPLDESDIVILFNRSGAALINLGFTGKTLFDPYLQAVRVASWGEAAWFWAYLNSGVVNEWGLLVKVLGERIGHSNSTNFDPFVPLLPKMAGAQLDKALNVAAMANSELSSELERATHYEYRSIVPGSKWTLQPAIANSRLEDGELLADLVTEIVPGKFRGGEERELMPVATARWVRGDGPSVFGDGDAKGSVIAEPGNLVTPSLGDVSFSRIVEEPMLVHSTCFVIRLKENVSSSYVNNFLNSLEATRQRRLRAQDGAFIRTFRAGDLRNMRVVSSLDFVHECRQIVMEVLAT
jgi:hypothetical protein